MKFTVEGTMSGDDAYLSFGKVHEAEVVSNIMLEDKRMQGYIVLDLDGQNRIVGIEIIGVSGLVRNGVRGLIEN